MSQSMPMAHLVDNALAARILADPKSAVFLKPFMRGPATIKAAAEAFGLPIQTLHYRVEQMHKAGLLEVVAVSKRQGRPVKHYQAVSTSFRVPLELIPQRLLENLTGHAFWKARLERSLQKALREHPGSEIVVYRNADGLLVWGSYLEEEAHPPEHLNPQHPAILNLWNGGLMLDRDDAKALQRELWELYERYAHRNGSEKYVLHLGLAPTIET